MVDLSYMTKCTFSRFFVNSIMLQVNLQWKLEVNYLVNGVDVHYPTPQNTFRMVFLRIWDLVLLSMSLDSCFLLEKSRVHTREAITTKLKEFSQENMRHAVPEG